ncbi:MAG TPA: hypothetical protein VN958_18475 [Chitinophagaceae bacterium]|nr:hypothetical protein [Chitinophagaceae bacterium]
MDYTELDSVQCTKGNEGRVLSSGMFTLQGHDTTQSLLQTYNGETVAGLSVELFTCIIFLKSFNS